MRYAHGIRLTAGRCRWTRHGWLWRIVPHNRIMPHSPFRPGNHEFWYCAWCRRALCCQGWLPEDSPDRWVPFRPGVLWGGNVWHWQPETARQG